jgi:predicted DNA-binding protein (MmcQ/YjbR family)
MVTEAQMRKLASAMPGVVERSHFGKPDFRVKEKIFAGLSKDGKRGNVKLALSTQAIVMEAKPEAFTPAEAMWGRAGWTYVVLAETTLAELRLLLEEAYGLVAGARHPPRSSRPANKRNKRSKIP